MSHIFVSYHHDDARFAELLEDHLQEAGFQVWRDTDVQAGENWRDAIDDGIRDATTVIVIMSPRAEASPYVNYEWSFAIGAGVDVVPLLLDLPSEQMHPRLAILKALDFTDRLKRRWDQLFARLKQGGASARATVRRPGHAPAVVEEAARALNGLDPEERLHAINALQLSRDASAAGVLAEGLQHDLSDVRLRCALALSERKDARCLPVLIEALHSLDSSSGDSRACWDAIRSLGPAAVPGLLETLESENARDRTYAATMLADSGAGDTAVTALTRALPREPNDSARAAMIRTLAKLGRIAAEVLLPYINDPSIGVRIAVAEALGAVDKAAPLAPFLALVADSERQVRMVAVDQIGTRRDPCAVPALTDRLKHDPDEYVRGRAATALGVIGSVQCVPALIAAMNDDEGVVRHHAADAVRTIGGPDAVRGLLDIVLDPRNRSQFEAAELLAAFGERAVVPRLLDALSDTDERVRAAAATALGVQGNVDAVRALLVVLEDEDETVRRAAVQALANIGDAAAVAGLVRALGDSDEDVRLRAKGGLRRFDTPEARRAVRHL